MQRDLQLRQRHSSLHFVQSDIQRELAIKPKKKESRFLSKKEKKERMRKLEVDASCCLSTKGPMGCPADYITSQPEHLFSMDYPACVVRFVVYS